MVQAVKQKMVDELVAIYTPVKSVVVLECSALPAVENDALRARLRGKGLRMKLVHNRLTAIALRNGRLDGVQPLLSGPTAFVFADDPDADPAAMAKAASEVTKKMKTVNIRGGFVEGTLLSADQVDALAKLPNREQMLALVAGTLASPMTSLGRAMNQIIAKLGYALQARIDQLKEAG